MSDAPKVAILAPRDEPDAPLVRESASLPSTPLVSRSETATLLARRAIAVESDGTPLGFATKSVTCALTFQGSPLRGQPFALMQKALGLRCRTAPTVARRKFVLVSDGLHTVGSADVFFPRKS